MLQGELEMRHFFAKQKFHGWCEIIRNIKVSLFKILFGHLLQSSQAGLGRSWHGIVQSDLWLHPSRSFNDVGWGFQQASGAELVDQNDYCTTLNSPTMFGLFWNRRMLIGIRFEFGKTLFEDSCDVSPAREPPQISCEGSPGPGVRWASWENQGKTFKKKNISQDHQRHIDLESTVDKPKKHSPQMIRRKNSLLDVLQLGFDGISGHVHAKIGVLPHQRIQPRLEAESTNEKIVFSEWLVEQTVDFLLILTPRVPRTITVWTMCGTFCSSCQSTLHVEVLFILPLRPHDVREPTSLTSKKQNQTVGKHSSLCEQSLHFSTSFY